MRSNLGRGAARDIKLMERRRAAESRASCIRASNFLQQQYSGALFFLFHLIALLPFTPERNNGQVRVCAFGPRPHSKRLLLLLDARAQLCVLLQLYTASGWATSTSFCARDSHFQLGINSENAMESGIFMWRNAKLISCVRGIAEPAFSSNLRLEEVLRVPQMASAVD